MEFVKFTNVSITDDILKNRIETITQVSIKHAIKKLYVTPRLQNFMNAKKAIDGVPNTGFVGITFDDSDVYKVVEGASYILAQQYSVELDDEVDKIVELISGAQESDGYITTRHTINPDLKWCCHDAHELYNMGLLIEAAIAHYQATKKNTLFKVAIKAADNIYKYFGLNNKWVPGHEEIELALIKLYEITKDDKYLDLAERFLYNRGRGFGIKNGQYALGEMTGNFDGNYHSKWDKEYYQDEIPIEYLTSVSGHAVRAMYLFTAMTMLTKYRKTNYLNALNTVWSNLMSKNVYITGGIGSSKHNEGFTEDYELPNLSAYCETCASVGMVYWNSEMFLQSKNTKYLEVIDRELKNGVICGLSEDGTKFSYDNPLSSKGEFQRSEWFETSCCPTQSLRFISSISKYIYAENDKEFYLNLLISSNYTKDNERLSLRIDDNCIEIETNIDKILKIRVPSYYIITGSTHKYLNENGYIVIAGNLEPITIYIQKTIQYFHSNCNVLENKNKIAVLYDGYLYCIEEIDNSNYEDTCLYSGLNYEVSKKKLKSISYNSITARNSQGETVAKLIPYFLWNNRGMGQMDVWIKNNTKHLYNI